MDAKAVEYLVRADRKLAILIRKVGPCTLKPKRRTPFEALVRAVTFQQLNGTAAEAILGRVKALFPGSKFPTPKALLEMPEERLRAAGLSRAKIAAVKDIAAKTLAGVVPDSRTISRMTEEEIRERLLELRGVGPWTVEMLLIFTLGRLDVWPVTDYGVRKGFARTFGWKELPTPRELLEHGERWRPYRTTAAWYFWRALELPD
jgi:3-methyladenine DNA glycosylase/8-oxoguanine DNA glycosylase